MKSSSFHIYKKDVAFNHIDITMSQLTTGKFLTYYFQEPFPYYFWGSYSTFDLS